MFPQPPPSENLQEETGQCTCETAMFSSMGLGYMPSCLEVLNTGFPTHTATEQLPLAKVREAINEVRSDWYSLSVELEISHGFRKVRVITVRL